MALGLVHALHIHELVCNPIKKHARLALAVRSRLDAACPRRPHPKAPRLQQPHATRARRPEAPPAVGIVRHSNPATSEQQQGQPSRRPCLEIFAFENSPSDQYSAVSSHLLCLDG